MRADQDFSAYVVARWVPVLRVLVVLGQPVDPAEEIAVASFARLLPDWNRLRREDDVEVELARVVLDAWVRSPDRLPVPAPVPVPAARVMTQELEDQLALLERLVEGLARIDERTRVAVVLHHLGELDRQQVADVLGESVAEVSARLSEAAGALDLGPLDPVCHSAAGAIDVPPPSVARVLARASAGRRRRWLVTGSLAGAVVVALAASYVWTRPPPPPTPDQVTISSVENIVGVPWWYDGVLHLHHGTAEVADVAQLVDVGDGVVYSDRRGRLVSLDEDGNRRDLGSMDPAGRLVSQPRLGWVAWLRPDGGDIVVYDASIDREVGRIGGAVDARLISWDRERLYFHREGNDWGVTVNAVGIGEATRVEPPEGYFGSVLLDVASGSQLRSRDGRLSVVHAMFNVEPEIAGTGGVMSPDGNFVVTRVAQSRLSLFDTRTGLLDGAFFDEHWDLLAASFTADGRVAWVADPHDGGFGLYECQSSTHYINSMNPGQEPCTERYDLDGVPLLAGVPFGLTQTPRA